MRRGAGAAAAARHLGLQDAELVQRFSEIRQRADIKICGEGGGAGGRAADQRGAGAAAAARHLGLQRADSEICSTDWNRLRVCRSALVETWPMLGLRKLLLYKDIMLNG